MLVDRCHGARSSAGEHPVYTRAVGGSKPSAPTHSAMSSVRLRRRSATAWRASRRLAVAVLTQSFADPFGSSAPSSSSAANMSCRRAPASRRRTRRGSRRCRRPAPGSCRRSPPERIRPSRRSAESTSPARRGTAVFGTVDEPSRIRGSLGPDETIDPSETTNTASRTPAVDHSVWRLWERSHPSGRADEPPVSPSSEPCVTTTADMAKYDASR
jgi:hypothetical protein